MIILRQKEFIFKTPTVKNIISGTKAVGKTLSGFTTNPGAATRRAIAGTAINPSIAAGTVADLGITAVAPAYGASPIGLKHLAMAVPSDKVSTVGMKRWGRNFMRNNGQSSASRLGQKIEYNINRAALGASRLGSMLPI